MTTNELFMQFKAVEYQFFSSGSASNYGFAAAVFWVIQKSKTQAYLCIIVSLYQQLFYKTPEM